MKRMDDTHFKQKTHASSQERSQGGEKMKRILILALSLMLVVSLAACGASPATTSGSPAASTSAPVASTEAAAASTEAATAEATPAPELEQVNLIFYVLGDKPKDFDMVAGKMNEKSTADLKCTVETKFISWADFSTKYPLVFASGEKFDTIYTASWSYYAQQSVKNGFLELTPELMTQYAPNSWSQIPKDVFEQARINGKIYMIPNWQDEFNHLGILIRGDLREKYNLPEIKTVSDYEKYLSAVAENDSAMIPYDGGSDFDYWTLSAVEFMQPMGLWSPIAGYVVSLTDPKAELKKLSEMPEYITYLKKMVDFNKQGLWSKNALNNKVAIKDSFLNGKSASALHNLGTMAGTWRQVTDAHPEWKPEIYDSMENFPTIKTSALGNGMAIFANAENPERALMWIDKVRFDQSYFDLMMYGIEGTHWKDQGPGLMSAGPNALDYGGFSNWGFNTKPVMRKGTDTWPGFDAVIKSWSDRAVIAPVNYMSFDDAKVKNEVAGMTNITRKYSRVLDFGFDKDPEKLLAEYEKQLDAAGRDKVIAEWNIQRDAVLAASAK